MKGWGKRLGPLLLVGFVALGAFLWKGGGDLLPAERVLFWKVPGDYASIRRLELQLYRGETLLKREELKTPAGLSEQPSQKVVLRRGRYTARMLVWREGAVEPQAHSTQLEVGDAETVTVE